MIQENQIENIKKQIINQINSTFPEDKKSFAINQIKEMNNAQLEEFLIQNNLIKIPEKKENKEKNAESNENENQCIFCSIAKNLVPSIKIDETLQALAILEINPLAKGHTLIIPKNHEKEIDIESEQFSKEISEKIKIAFNPKKIIIEPREMFGHSIIDIIPVYGEELKAERKQATKEELEKVKEKIISKPEQISKPEIIKEQEKKELEVISEKTPFFPKRIP